MNERVEGEYGFVNCVELDGDRYYEIRDLEQILKEIRAKYGSKSLIGFDAGHNSVSVLVKPSKKVKGATNGS